MKVFHVLNHFLPHRVAGTEVYAFSLAKNQTLMGYDIEIIIPNYGNEMDDSYNYEGLKVFKFSEPSVVNRSLIMGFSKPGGLKSFIQHIESGKPDIIHFHELAGSNGVGVNHVIAAKNSGAKVIMTFHLGGYSCKTGNLFYKDREICDGTIDIKKCSACYLNTKSLGFFRPLLSGISSALFEKGINTTVFRNRLGTALGTGYVINELKKNFEILVQNCDILAVYARWYKRVLMVNGVPEEKIIYIAPGITYDAANILPDNNDYKPEGRVRLLFLGRISRYKGIDLLIDALEGVDDGKFELDIYGQTDDENFEKKLKEKTKAMKYVRWMGRLNQQDVISTMKKYDALCLCSAFSEMSPLVIQEAFAAGLPVIASNAYGNAEQIKDSINGFLFRFKDAGSLRKILLKVSDSPRILNEMKKNIIVPRSFSSVAEDYEILYSSLMAAV